MVPPGDVTAWRKAVALASPAVQSSADPASVSRTRVAASCRSRPIETAASIHASATRKTYAGPLPCTAVAASSVRSVWTSISVPNEPRICWVRRRSSASTPLPAIHTVTPRPTCAGVFGIARTTRGVPSDDSMVSSRTPAMIEITSCVASSAGRIASATAGKDCGFTASTSACAPVTSCGRPRPAVAPFAVATASRRAASISLTTIEAAGTTPLAAKAETTAPPIAPAPMTAMRSLTNLDLTVEPNPAILPAASRRPSSPPHLDGSAVDANLDAAGRR